MACCYNTIHVEVLWRAFNVDGVGVSVQLNRGVSAACQQRVLGGADLCGSLSPEILLCNAPEWTGWRNSQSGLG